MAITGVQQNTELLATFLFGWAPFSDSILKEKSCCKICQIGCKITPNLHAHLGLHICTFFFAKTGKGRMNEICSEVNLHLFQRSLIPSSTSVTTSGGSFAAGLLTLYQTGLVRVGGSEYSQGCARGPGLFLSCLC